MRGWRLGRERLAVGRKCARYRLEMSTDEENELNQLLLVPYVGTVPQPPCWIRADAVADVGERLLLNDNEVPQLKRHKEAEVLSALKNKILSLLLFR